MSVIIGSARIDENGKATGGRAGDQMGKEVSTQSWYKHSKGWRVFRAKEAAVAEAIARCMQAACDNRHVGYDQGQRNSLYSEAEKFGFDVSKVTKDVECDCSALVRVCCAAAGITGLPAGFRTNNEPGNLLKTGAFAELTGTKYTDSSAYLRRGDILCTKTQGHTVVVLSNGPKAEPIVAAGPQLVEITGGTVNVRSAPGTTGTRVLGIARKGDKLTYQDQTMNVDGRDWYLVVFKNQNGWVSSRYARRV